MAGTNNSMVVQGGDSIKSTPYTLFASDNHGSVIMYVHFNGENYNEWASKMLNALRAKKKIGFIDGTIPKHADVSGDYEGWIIVNSMVVGWLRTSIVPRVRSTVSFITDATSLWSNLNERFCVENKVRVHHMRTHIAMCKEDGQSVMDFHYKKYAY